MRPIGHEERLSIVDHLDELRSRMMVCGGVLLFAFFICFWQNHALLHVLNRALPSSASIASQDDVANLQNVYNGERAALRKLESGATALAQPASKLPAADGAYFNEIAAAAKQFLTAIPKKAQPQVKPITIGIGEPFTTTLT